MLPWGGDVWRHLAVENKLISGEPELPVLFGQGKTFRNYEITKLGNYKIPDVLVVPHKYSYGQLWGTSVAIAKIFDVSLLTVNKWLVPILWSVAMPILLFRIGTLLFASKRYGLWLAGLMAFPFSWQALGSLTLPVSLGYITFFFVLSLWLEYLFNKEKSQRNLALLFATFMVFGYSLHFILIWSVIIITYGVRFILGIKHDLLRRSLAVVGFFASLWIIPVLELITK